MLFYIGALVPTYLISRFFIFVFEKIFKKDKYIFANLLSALVCGSIFAFFGTNSFNHYFMLLFAGIINYMIPQFVWLIRDVLIHNPQWKDGKFYRNVKNIFFVSYIKNKGVRRLCFVIGLLFGIISLGVWKSDLKYNFFDLSFQNIEEVQRDYSYNNEVLKAIFEKYPVNIGETLTVFANWENFFINKYSSDYKYRMHLMNECQVSKSADMHSICDKLNAYASQKITVSRHNLYYFFNLWYVMFFFYLPFVFVVVIRWIVVGFKEKKETEAAK